MSYPMELSITGYEKFTPLTEKESAPLRSYWKFSTSPSTVVELRWAYWSSVYRSIMLCKLISAKTAMRAIQTIYPTLHFGVDRDFIKEYMQYRVTITLTIKKRIIPVENTCASQTVFITISFTKNYFSVLKKKQNNTIDKISKKTNIAEKMTKFVIFFSARFGGITIAAMIIKNVQKNTKKPLRGFILSRILSNWLNQYYVMCYFSGSIYLQ